MMLSTRTAGPASKVTSKPLPPGGLIARKQVIILTWLLALSEASPGRGPSNLDEKSEVGHHQVSLLGPTAAIRTNNNASQLCQMDCNRSRNGPVCGTDDVTYDSRCELHQTMCFGKDVKLKYRGECQQANRCVEERMQALKASEESEIPIYVPVCHEDGQYVDVQCHYGTGYCWCVNQEGKPVPGSSIRYSRPKCRRNEGRSRNRRGKKRDRNQALLSSSVCNQADRSEFNSAVAELMMGEHRSLYPPGRSPEVSGGTAATTVAQRKREVVGWKFDQMDFDGDGVLRRAEFRDFRRAVKRLVRNKGCAKNFWPYCDMDSDGLITMDEWNSCLGLSFNIPFKLFLSLSSEEDKASAAEDDDDDDREDHRRRHRQQGLLLHHRRRHHMDESQRGPSAAPRREPLYPDAGQDDGGHHDAGGHDDYDYDGEDVVGDDSKDDEAMGVDALTGGSGGGGGGDDSAGSEGDNNCWTANRRATGSVRSRSRNNLLVDGFVPECEADGAFKRVQCHKASGYCWCVDPASGNPIRGTSVHKAVPDCLGVTTAGSLPTMEASLRTMAPNTSSNSRSSSSNASAAAGNDTVVRDFLEKFSDGRGRAWAKCNEVQRGRFLEDLMDHMTSAFVASSSSRSSSSSVLTHTLTFLFQGENAKLNTEQRAAKWQFLLMDLNGNGLVSRKELKPFRRLLTSRKRLRRCGRRIQLHCDLDLDRNISEMEWNLCVNAYSSAEDVVANIITTPGPAGQRRGQNPLNRWLKSD